jgi:phospholipase/carboxylesterase
MHEYVLIEKGKPLSEASNAIILLHGRGGRADDIIGLADEFCDHTFYIAAPQAKDNTWYPYTFLGPEEKNEPWLTSSVQRIKRLIEEIMVYIPVERIFLTGFSQGACLALEVAGRYPSQYGGVVAFSGGLIGETIKPEKYKGDLKGAKVIITCSEDDAHIPLARAKQSAELLKKMGADVVTNFYSGNSHMLTKQEVDWVKKLMF